MDSEFIDAESYTGNKEQTISFKLIVLQHLQKITFFASKEWRGGYWDVKPVQVGGVTANMRTYVPDTREEYANAVNVLADLLLPHFDSEMASVEESINTELYEEKKRIKDEVDEREQSDTYRRYKASNRRKLLRELTKFLYRKKYLELGVVEV